MAALLLLAASCLDLPAAPGMAFAEISLPATPANYVVDLASIIDDRTEAGLNAYLGELERKTTAQFVVLTIKSLEGRAIEDFSIDVAHKRWKLGQKGKDNGLLLTVSVEDRKYRIEVGYGLEGTLPDSFVGSVGRDELVPRFRQGDTSGGIARVVVALSSEIAKAQGVTLETGPKNQPRPVRRGARHQLSPFEMIAGLVLLAIAAIFFIRNPSLFLAFMAGQALGGGRRHSGFGGGGFGGGGGGFGGGGGGGFGGGGSSGSW